MKAGQANIMNNLLGQTGNQIPELREGGSFSHDSDTSSEAALANALRGMTLPPENDSRSGTIFDSSQASFFDGGQLDTNSPFSQEALARNTGSNNLAEQLRTLGGVQQEAPSQLGINTRSTPASHNIFDQNQRQHDQRLNAAEEYIDALAQDRKEKPEDQQSAHTRAQSEYNLRNKQREQELLERAKKEARRSQQLGSVSGRKTLLNKEHTPRQSGQTNILVLAEAALSSIIQRIRMNESQRQAQRAADKQRHQNRGGFEGMGGAPKTDMTAELANHAPHEISGSFGE